MNLGQKIALIVICGMLTISSALFKYNTKVFEDSIKNEFEDRIATLGENLSSTVKKILPLAERGNRQKYIDPEVLANSARPILEAGVERTDVIYAVFYMDKKQVVAASFMNESYFKKPQSGKTGKKFKKYDLYSVPGEGKDVYEIKIPVERNGAAEGEIYYAFDMGRINKQIDGVKRTSLLIAGGGAFIIGLLMFLYLSVSVIGPIRKITSGAQSIGNGQLSAVNADELGRIRKKDEIGLLVRSFIQMNGYLSVIGAEADKISRGEISTGFKARSEKDELGASIERMLIYLNGVTTALEQIATGDLSSGYSAAAATDILGTACEGMTRNLKQIVTKLLEQSNLVAASSENLAQIANQMQVTSQQLAETTSHISQAVSQTAENTVKAAEASGSADKAAKKGRAIIEDILKKMDGIQETNTQSTLVMQQLNEYSKEINLVVDLIKGITEEMKLLSFNAVIEAARAGESGRGFTVVAEQVRELSDSSAQQVKKITGIIHKVSSGITAAVKAAETAEKEISEGAGLIQESEQIFSDIVSLVDTSSVQTENIAATSEEIASSTEEVAATSEEQTASSQELSSMASELSQTSKTMKESVEKFKV